MNERIPSRSGTPFPRWMAWIALAVGLLLMADALRSFSFHKLLVGACCVYVSSYRKRMYLADEGVVRETGGWFGKRQSLIPWSEVTFVTLARRGRQMMAFFERGDSGWKLLFDRTQQEPVEALLREKCPGIEVDVL